MVVAFERCGCWNTSGIRRVAKKMKKFNLDLSNSQPPTPASLHCLCAISANILFTPHLQNETQSENHWKHAVTAAVVAAVVNVFVAASVALHSFPFDFLGSKLESKTDQKSIKDEVNCRRHLCIDF